MSRACTAPTPAARAGPERGDPYPQPGSEADAGPAPSRIDCRLEPVVVRGSAEELARALRNLMDNAVSFSPPGAPVGLAVRREGSAAVVEVSDRGPGVPEQSRLRVFDRFYTDRLDAEIGEHTGLGLAIVKATVEAHGGSVAVDAGPGGGARFTVRLPLR